MCETYRKVARNFPFLGHDIQLSALISYHASYQDSRLSLVSFAASPMLFHGNRNK